MLQVPLGRSKIKIYARPLGTSDLKRVMVSLEQDKPKTILGYVREVNGFKWIAEGDPQNGRLRRRMVKESDLYEI